MEEVKEQLGNLREDKAPGPDNYMQLRVLMEVAEQVSEMLTDIFNSSFESGQVPEDWRVANVTPLLVPHTTGRGTICLRFVVLPSVLPHFLSGA